ncbi:MAG: Mu-like prophage major head subunit gpT family protein [Dehalococcoidia bacterium]
MATRNAVNGDALDAFVVTFKSEAERLFTSVENTALVNAFCSEVSSEGGQNVTQIFGDHLGTWKELIGGREEAPSRIFSQNVTLATYYVPDLVIPRKDFQYDNIGVNAARVRTYMSNALSAHDVLLHQALALASGKGPVGYDGVNVFDDDHPYAPAAGTQSNYGTAAMSWVSVRAALASMTSLLRENSEPFNIVPRFLIGGPKNAEIMEEITNGNLRLAGAATDGIEGGTRAYGGAIDNVQKGRLTGIIDYRLVGAKDDWWGITGTDTTGQLKPLMVMKGMAPLPQINVDDQSQFVHDNDAYSFGLITDMKIAAGAWQAGFWNVL